VAPAAATLRGGELLHIFIPGIAPAGPPPPFPPILHEDDRVVVIDKPPGLLTHPAGTDYAWAVVSLAKARWPDADLVHRIDKDTSGVLVLAKDDEATRLLKTAFHDGHVRKRYLAITRGRPTWDRLVCEQPIGPAGGPIRIQMAVRADGLAAHTEFEVLERHASADLALVACDLFTGRTHQIRVHLAHAGHAILGDRMYGVPPDVFLRAWEGGVDDEVIRRAGAPRHALHAASCEFPHPNGGRLRVEAALAPDIASWWASPPPASGGPASAPTPR
jgi:23S rRNA pseudouridine1911/1915/1917 synthase